MSEMTPAITCPSCGAANLPGSRFCSSCATPLSEATSAAETRKALATAREAAALYAKKGATILVERTEKLIAEWSA
jgi:uncharacterized OB-fold protein